MLYQLTLVPAKLSVGRADCLKQVWEN